jgi:cupin 2 domain-containing protein
MPNLLDHIPEELPAEWADTLLEQGGLRIERIVSRGHASPSDGWFCQESDEWVLLFRGAAELEYRASGERVRLAAGDWLFIPAGREHRVSWTPADRDTVWLALHWTAPVANRPPA